MSDTENAATQREIELKQRKIELKQKENDLNRSRVRRWVTYSAVWTYLLLSGLTILRLLRVNEYDMAIAVLGAVGSMSGSILGFWFGSRQQNATTMSTAPDDRKGEDKKG